MGEMFSEPTTNPMRLDRPVVDDISAIGEAESDLRRGDRGAVVGVRGDEQPAAARVPGVEPGLKVAAVSGCNGCHATRRAAASTTGVSPRIHCIRARVSMLRQAMMGMMLADSHVLLTRITPAIARRIIDRAEQPGDDWHPDYPFADELDPLAALAASEPQDSPFTMYAIRRPDDRVAVGGFGFFGPPDETGAVEFGYGLIPAARGEGLASAAVTLALHHAQRWGATRAKADTELSNAASRRVLEKAGLREVGRRDGLVFFERALA